MPSIEQTDLPLSVNVRDEAAATDVRCVCGHEFKRDNNATAPIPNPPVSIWDDNDPETQLSQCPSCDRELTPDAERLDWIEGLREIADFLEQRPDLAAPWPAMLTINSTDREHFAEQVRAFGGGDKNVTGSFFNVTQKFGPHSLDVTAIRDEVCEQVITGQETVTIPDPDAEMVEVTRPVTEWRCPDSILGKAA